MPSVIKSNSCRRVHIFGWPVRIFYIYGSVHSSFFQIHEKSPPLCFDLASMLLNRACINHHTAKLSYQRVLLAHQNLVCSDLDTAIEWHQNPPSVSFWHCILTILCYWILVNVTYKLYTDSVADFLSVCQTQVLCSGQGRNSQGG